MPSYDYRCAECKADFSVERSMTDESKQACLACGTLNVNRVWSVFIVSGGSTPDHGQSTSSAGAAPRKSGCGSCVSRSCGTCH